MKQDRLVLWIVLFDEIRGLLELELNLIQQIYEIKIELEFNLRIYFIKSLHRFFLLNYTVLHACVLKMQISKLL